MLTKKISAMKTVLFVSIALFIATSYHGCQDNQDDLKGMSEVIQKMEPRKKGDKYFDSVNRGKYYYFIINPTPEKVDIVHQQKAKIEADNDVELIRVMKMSEANIVIR